MGILDAEESLLRFKGPAFVLINNEIKDYIVFGSLTAQRFNLKLHFRLLISKQEERVV